MEKKGRYLTLEETNIIKIFLIKNIYEIIKKTSLEYYYNFLNLSNLINNKIKRIYISDETLPKQFKKQDDTLIIDKVFNHINIKNRESLANLMKFNKTLLFRMNEIGLQIIGNSDLDNNLKDALAIYFARNEDMEEKNFYSRKIYTNLPFFDFRFNTINNLSSIVGEDVLAHTLYYGDEKISEELNKIANHKGILKKLTIHLNKINTIQNELLKYNLRYLEINDLYYKILARINTLSVENKSTKEEEIKKMENNQFFLLDSDVQTKLIKILRIYKNMIVVNDVQNGNFVEDLENVLSIIKIKIDEILNVLDHKNMELNNFIINNILLKYIRKNDLEEDKITDILKSLEYQIKDKYNYVEDSKLSKKLKKLIEK